MKKVLAILLCMALVMSFLGVVTAFANNNQGNDDDQGNNGGGGRPPVDVPCPGSENCDCDDGDDAGGGGKAACMCLFCRIIRWIRAWLANR